jgi:uncharacterized RDD family membrane protein YckC
MSGILPPLPVSITPLVVVWIATRTIFKPMSRLSKFLRLKNLMLCGGANLQLTNHSSNDEHNEVTIETLKTPPLRINPAPISKRIFAALVDSLIVTIVWLLLVLWEHQMFENRLQITVEYFAMMFLYYVLQESIFASTIGKHLLGLRIVGYSGDPITMRESLIRNFLRFVDWLPALYPIGIVSIAISPRKQRVGDIIAGTIVTPVAKRDINPPPAPFLFH